MDLLRFARQMQSALADIFHMHLVASSRSVFALLEHYGVISYKAKKDNLSEFQISRPFSIYMFYIFAIILSQENFLFSHVPAVQTALSAVCLPQSFHDP